MCVVPLYMYVSTSHCFLSLKFDVRFIKITARIWQHVIQIHFSMFASMENLFAVTCMFFLVATS